jgi:hypothetical protein
MLQAREYACILILAAAIGLPAPACAQQDDDAGDPQTLQRLGDKPVENEYELDVTVPPNTVTPPPPESPEQRAAEGVRRRATTSATRLSRRRECGADRSAAGRLRLPFYRSADLDAANQTPRRAWCGCRTT